MKWITCLFILAITVISCAPDSKITRAWKNSTRTRSYHDIVVVSLTHDVNARQVVEGDLAEALMKRQIVVSKSIDIFPPTFSKDTPKEEMLSKIRTTGADAILTVSLINKETKTNYVPGNPGYTPGFWGYYSFWYPTVYSPGYYTQDRVYYMETNLYDAATDALIWTAQSETYNPSSLTGFSRELANILATRLQKDKIISPTDKLPLREKKVSADANK